MHCRADFSTWAISSGKSKEEVHFIFYSKQCQRCDHGTVLFNAIYFACVGSAVQHWPQSTSLQHHARALGAAGKSRDIRVLFVKLGHD